MAGTNSYSIQPHTSEWTLKFIELKKLLLDIFGGKITLVEHVGSTSIPGIKAKPVIDVLMLVNNIEDLEEEIENIKSKGYVVRKNVLTERSFLFEKVSGGTKEQNIHVFEKDTPYAQSHFISVRDYLRAHPAVAQEYEKLKEDLYAKHPNDYEAYRAGKDEFLKKLEETAQDWVMKN